ncbi:MAG TPA: amino acid adenylation domain-containing protein, partial [Thermoanaerobaculia bacterium]|nr:amino acid adenylation domain-containing protein [Thermoanaerobaculia bacterium]
MMSEPSKPLGLSREEKLALLERLTHQKERVSRTFPLSFAQQRLWFLDQLDPGNHVNNIFRAQVWHGPLDVAALQRALTEIVRRHESLRAVFPTVDGEARQRVTPAAEVPLPVEDLSGYRAETRRGRAQERAHAESRHAFDLANGPLFRAGLLRLAPEEHVLLLGMHHIVSDGWSMGLLFRELTVLYRAFAGGLTSPLPELPLQYPDFAAWQRDKLAGSALDAGLVFWRERLAGADTVLELPADRPRPALESFRGAIHLFSVPEADARRLAALGREAGATTFMTLLAAYEVLLHRVTGQADFLIGTPVAGRDRAEVEELIGFFANTLLLRARLTASPTFREVLARVRRDTLEGYGQADVPFERIVEELRPERHLSHNPLFQTMFALQNQPGGAVELPGLDVEPLSVDRGLAKLDLTLEMAETAEGLEGYFEYNTDLFDGATIERLAACFRTLLSGLAAQPERPVGDLPLLSNGERRWVLTGWNPAPTAEPAEPVHRLFAGRAAETPEAPAVLFGGERLTYGELDRRANRLARHLRTLGVGPDVAVGVCLERSFEMAEAVLAVLKAGGAYVPLDPGYPRERLAYMVEDTGMRVLLTQERLASVLPEVSTLLRVDADRALWEKQGEAAPRVEIHPDSLAYVIYTSGSTGKPKGVQVPHRAIANHAAAIAARYSLGPADRVFQFASLSFDIAAEEMFPTWISGAALVPRPAGLFPSFGELEAMVGGHGVTVANIPTPYWHEWVTHLARTGGQPPQPLRLVIVGTEQASPERLAEWRRLTPVRWINAYGPTETTITATVHEPVADQEALRIPIGLPIANLQAYVLDAGLEPVPLGVVGGLYIGGAGVARGYLHHPDRTAEAFLPDPYSTLPGARFYHTGDRARRLPSGEIEFLGRADDQVKIRGFRIEPGEVEAALGRLPGVQECTVVVREDAGEKRLVAYMVPGTLQEDGLRSALAETLPSYMVPAAFVPLDILPLTPSGKVDRKALPAPEAPHEAAPVATGSERSPLEEMVAGIWSEVLRLERIGDRQSFFELGGHSLLATQVISRIRESLGVELPLRVLFEAPTVTGLAAAVEAASRAEQGLAAPPVVPVPRTGTLVCSFAQQRLWVLDKLMPESPAYHLPAAVRFQGTLDVPVLERALGELVRRHESLRTTFALADAKPVQVIAPAEPDTVLALPPVDLTLFPYPEAEAWRRLVDESVRPFDLEKGPLLRAVLYRTAPDYHLLLVTVHHIVSDGTSIQIFLSELVTLYGAFSRGEGSPLASLPLQYADFAAWQRAWLHGEVLEKQIGYWRQQLDGAPAVLELPTDRPRPAVQSAHGARHYFALPDGLSSGVAALGKRQGTTLFMTLLAAFDVLLSRWSGQEDVLAGWPIAGRDRAGLDGLIGFFANMLVLRADLAGEPSFHQLLGRVREAALGAYTHGDLPFEQLVEELQPERHLSHNPIFQVFFVLHHVPDAPAGPGLPGLSLSFPSIDNRTARLDLSLSLTDGRDGLAGFLEYNTDLFDGASIERMAGHLVELMIGAVTDPDAAVAALPMLSFEERRQLVEGWNETRAALPAEPTVHALIEAQAARTPEAFALTFETEDLTYAQLNARANRVAHALRRRGAGPGTLVGIFLERSADMVAALLGVLKSGAAYVPLDPTYPPDRIAYVVEDSGAAILLTEERIRWDLPDVGEAEIVEIGKIEGLSAVDTHDPEPLAGPGDLAYVIYTSGSTGRPKGVEVRHGGVVNFLASMARQPGITADDALVAVTTISFDIAGLELYLPLMVGARIALASRETAIDGAALIGLLDGATVMQATPATWRLLLAAGWDGNPALKALCGGEALPGDLARELAERVESLWNVYGPTETTIWSAVRPVATGYEGNTAVPVGRPIANTSIHLLDPRFEPVPVGVVGELYIGGDGLARGYLRRPSLTAERFLPDPFAWDTGTRIYRTGDLARRLPDGEVEFIGRADHQVKVRGYRIELGEIEAALAEHPAVAQAVVVVRPDAAGIAQLVAYLVQAEGKAASVGNLRASLRESLPEYMIPSTFVTLSAFPLTPNGKVDRKSLPAPGSERPELERELVAPRTPVEEGIAAIWAE